MNRRNADKRNFRLLLFRWICHFQLGTHGTSHSNLFVIFVVNNGLTLSLPNKTITGDEHRKDQPEEKNLPTHKQYHKVKAMTKTSPLSRLSKKGFPQQQSSTAIFLLSLFLFLIVVFFLWSPNEIFSIWCWKITGEVYISSSSIIRGGFVTLMPRAIRYRDQQQQQQTTQKRKVRCIENWLDVAITFFLFWLLCTRTNYLEDFAISCCRLMCERAHKPHTINSKSAQ